MARQTAAKKSPPRARRKNGKPKQQQGAKPLPPPVPVEGVQATGTEGDPFNLAEQFSNSGPESAGFSASSSTSEPAPGEPLPAEAEAALGDVPESIGADPDDQDEPEAMGAGMPGVGSLLPSIGFDELKVRKYLVETFDWLADRFDSKHWALTDNQADMLAGPTAELLGGIWSKMAVILPDALTSFPGATAFLFAVSFVVVPKAAQQMAISRARKTGQVPPAKKPGPVAVPRPQPLKRDYPASMDAVPGAASDSDFQVTGD